MKIRLPFLSPSRSRRPDSRPVGPGRAAVRRALDDQLDALRDAGWSRDELAELQDFVAGESRTTRADPGFKERLRLDLWWLIVTRWTAARRDTPRG